MNARDSLVADRDAEALWEALQSGAAAGAKPERITATALVAIAAELRAARVYANYLEGRQGSRTRQKADRQERLS